ncbi:hypothetical protein LUZ61_013339 [Rhynchospora tenuis]|uniref:F-box domain-containing protein n=1 Tax=Rhynchospora tenuis TaxID=198213 RepID=A0AAD5W8H0_9POAL|nr:hypothetical protein LUZ61_013339 [Rhynchospora tenuis]
MAMTMAMSCSLTDANQANHLSNLPDDLLITILSLLPTCIAARTSVVSRRFRHLWKASPSVQLIIGCLPHPCDDNFIAMVDRALFHRDPCHPLVSLYLHYDFVSSLPNYFLPSLFAKARSLGLRHLTIECFLIDHLLPDIFSINSLESLSLPDIGSSLEFPSGFTLTCLRNLSLSLDGSNSGPSKITQLLSELGSLEDLDLSIRDMERISLSSQTVRKLRLMSRNTGYKRLHTVELFLPSLESLRIKSCSSLSSLAHLHGEVPLLKRAVISLHRVHAEHRRKEKAREQNQEKKERVTLLRSLLLIEQEAIIFWRRNPRFALTEKNPTSLPIEPLT